MAVAPPVVVQSIPSNISIATQTSFTLALSGVVAGNLLFVATCIAANASATSITGGGATWVKIPGTKETSGTTRSVEWWVGTAGTGGSITITVNHASNISGGTLLEVSGGQLIFGADSGDALAWAAGGKNATTANPVSLAVNAPGSALVLLATYSTTNQTATPGAPWTNITGPNVLGGSVAGLATQALSSDTAGSGTATWTASAGAYAISEIAILPAAGVQPIQQVNGAYSAAGTQNLALSGVVAGHILVAAVFQAAGATAASVSGGGASWTKIVDSASAAGVSLWVGKGTTGGSITVTVTYQAGSSVNAARIIELDISSILAATPINNSAHASSATAALTALSAMTNPALIVSAVATFIGGTTDATIGGPGAVESARYGAKNGSGFGGFANSLDYEIDIAQFNVSASGVAMSWSVSTSTTWGAAQMALTFAPPSYIPTGARQSNVAVMRAANWMESAKGLLIPERRRFWSPQLVLAR